ncbi:MAG: Spx/MgsR family RNA polymerase-binding regulatory protein [Sphingobacterium composti]|uniref:Spx/MgsR family RNA polymerase-binding regulatory protein n=1 Tax=Sphingobacterium composti TaxID=363260 RepID=UPI00135C163E|nr:Spx/MgsR family RNA polymerase-binding regulatory protein [Sphingobacterium composti Ten et al. 2007 non Yoo et al. 2007]
MLNVYGIKNCNTVKKALDWLNDHNIQYTFHDYKKEPAKDSKLIEWQKLVSWESLINKKGTTWKKLSPEQQAAVVDELSAREVLLQNNSMIKRPIVELKNEIILGFDEQIYQQKLSSL